MTLFYWNPQLETGNKRIDGQHKRLIDLTNDIAAAVGGGGRLPDIARLFDELLAYADTHFHDEEILMCECTLPSRLKEKHVCAHRNFRDHVMRMATNTNLSKIDTINEILEFLVNWLVTHILGLDHRMIQTLPNRTAGISRTRDGNISVQRALIAALTETERRFRLLAEQAPTLIWFCGPSGGRDFVNKRWLEFVGLTNSQADDADWVSLIFVEDQQRYLRFLQDRLQTVTSGEIEYRIKASNGDWRWMAEQVAPRMDGERCVGLVAATTDISVMRAATETLERLVAERTRQLELRASTDALTGLLNRRAFDERLDIEVKRAQRYGRPLSVLFCDIDYFKEINDRYGHSCGDAVLAKVARVFDLRLRNTDFLARYGGEEFVAVLTETNVAEAIAVAEAIRLEVLALDIASVAQKITISIGVASLVEEDNSSTFISRADKAMYAAKNAGRNCCRIVEHAQNIPFDLEWSKVKTN